MEINDVSVATISWARNEEEEKALQDSLEQLATLNIPVYIADGGSSKNFIQFLHSIPHFKIFEAGSLLSQIRTCIKEAAKSGVRFIFYTEPDKQEFFSKHLKRMLEEAIADEKTGVVIASRSASGFGTYPSFQQMTETTINNCCREVIEKEMDYCYGPFLFNSRLIPFLERLDDSIGWGWRPFLFATAKRLGYEIKSFEGDFNCPQNQREDDSTERIYRMKQLTQNINGLIQAATMNLSS
jgi:hypothetical protein